LASTRSCKDFVFIPPQGKTSFVSFHFSNLTQTDKAKKAIYCSLTMMNHMFNTRMSDMGHPYTYNDGKLSLSLQPGSLFSMALFDLDTFAHNNESLPNTNQQPAVFHPIDEYKDLSLKEILDLSDDFLFEDGESRAISPSMLDPTPLPPSTPIPLDGNNRGFTIPVSPDCRPQDVCSSVQPQHSSDVISESFMFETLTKKRRLESSMEDDDDSDDDNELSGWRFRPYQAGQWCEKFEELCEYSEKMGHCLVPHTFSENLPLARWVKRQRYQYKLMKEGKSSTMTEERVLALEKVGFVWDSQGAAWGERLSELRDFRKVYMHCNVPSNFIENPQLATWVKCQRRQYKLHLEGKPSNMTPQRIAELENLDFEWELRTYKKARAC
jgi:Helicase associated domain